MPTNLQTVRPYSTSPVSIWAGDEDMAAANMVSVDTTCIQADADGNQILNAGYPLMLLASGLGRPYPYTVASAVTAASGTTITPAEARYFKVGDVLTFARPYASATLSGAFANGVTINIAIDGTANAVPTYTVSGYVDLPTLATALVGYLNGQPAFAERMIAIADGATIHLFGKSATGFATALTASAGTFTASATALQTNIAIGAITAVNAVAGTLTVGAGAAIRVPASAPLAIAVDRSAIVGLCGYQYLLGSTNPELLPEPNDVPAYYAGQVWAARIPMPCDRWLREILPGIIARPR
jgi:hypothetical protein